jgi:hypothetical protein
MRISVALMPRPVAPDGVPGPQIAFSVPKSPLPGAEELGALGALLAALVDDGADPPPPDEDRPHPVTAMTSTAETPAVVTRAFTVELLEE